MKTTADIIIVGGGNAGCALAYRLSEKYSVILLEAGTDLSNDPQIYTPSNSGTLLNNVNTYFYPLGHSVDTSGNTRHPFPAVEGELLGGGSSVNGMQYVIGTAEYYQRWSASINDSDWGPENVSNTYKYIENFNGVSGNYDPNAHGYDGKLDVKQVTVNEQAATIFATAASEVANIPFNIDYNSFLNPLGSYIYWQVTETPYSYRASSFTAYLKSLLKQRKSCSNVYTSRDRCKNIQVVTKARVQRILFKELQHDQCNACSSQHVHHSASRKATGVSAVVNGECIDFSAKKYVMLTAGFQSASLLQLSGVGDAEYLSSICVPSIIDNPNVGKHMLNHPIISLTGVVVDNNPFTLPVNYNSQGLYSGGAQVPSSSSSRSYQLIGISSPNAPNVIPTTFTISGLVLDAQSEGYIQISNSDPNRPPIFNFNYFEDPVDLVSAVEMYGIMYNTLVKMGLQPTGPNPEDGPEGVEQYIENAFSQAYHWTGMTRMSTSAVDGVVNSSGKVHGSRNLYVADISVAPFNPTGNTQAIAYLIPNVIADKLLQKA